jgi:hypothetical protein
MENWFCSVKWIVPWTTTNLTTTISPTTNFEMEFTVNTIPDSKQYLLYAWDELKLFFDIITDNTKICYQYLTDNPICTNIGTWNNITITNVWWDISLNWNHTWKNISSEINNLYIWQESNWFHSLKMDWENLINMSIKK